MSPWSNQMQIYTLFPILANHFCNHSTTVCLRLLIGWSICLLQVKFSSNLFYNRQNYIVIVRLIVSIQQIKTSIPFHTIKCDHPATSGLTFSFSSYCHTHLTKSITKICTQMRIKGKSINKFFVIGIKATVFFCHRLCAFDESLRCYYLHQNSISLAKGRSTDPCR